MINNVATGLLLISLIIIIGFLSNYQFLRTGFPSVLFLIGLGVIVGPFLQLVGQESLAQYAPYLADLATIFILFESGLGINLRDAISKTPRALLMSGLHLVFCTLVVVVFLGVVGVNPVYGILVGTLLSGNSSLVLPHLSRRLSVDEEVVSVLKLESMLNNIFQVIFFLVLLDVISTGPWDLIVVTRRLVLRFGIGGAMGLGFGIFWLNLLSRIKGEAFGYMLTIATLFIIYYSAEFLGGDGALASLTFGVVLSNQYLFDRVVAGATEEVVFDDQMVQFEVELCFLIRTFFFVYIGLRIMIADLMWIGYGLVLSTLLFVARFAAVHVATIQSRFEAAAEVMSLVIPRGLNEAALTVVLVSSGLSGVIMYQNIIFLVIIMTNVLYMLIMYRLRYRYPTMDES